VGVRDRMKRWREPADGPDGDEAQGPTPAKLAKRVRVAHRLNDAQWQQLVTEVSAVTANWTRDQWWSLGVRDRVALSRAAEGAREDVELLAETRTVYGPTFKIDRDLRRIDLGLEVEVPGWLMVAQPDDFVARLMLEVAGSSPCIVAGTSFISGIPFRDGADSVKLEAVTATDRIEVPVTMRPDEVADAESGERWVDETAASWWASIDLDRSEEFTLVVTIDSAEITRVVETVIPARDPAAVGVSASAFGDGIELSAGFGALQVASSTADWANGWPPVKLPPKISRFGDSLTLPTGRYVVSGETPVELGDPDQLKLTLQERAIEMDGTLATLRGWSPGEADVSIAVRNPIPVADRGRRRQRMMLQEIRDQAGPLRERALAMCFGGADSADSVGPVVRELLSRGIPVDFCVTDYSVPVPEGANPILLHSREWHDAFTHARYLVNNAEFPHYVKFRDGQRYLQTWHGTPVKRVANDIANPKFSAGYAAALRREVAAWEALVAQNIFAGLVLPQAFGFERRTIVEGYPRNDRLANDLQLRNRTRAALGLGTELAVLYAPSWRDSTKEVGEARELESVFEASRVHEELGATVLLRGQANISVAKVQSGQRGVVDVTSYPDLPGLMAAADILITDHSAAMFDFSVTGRPQVFLIPQADENSDNDRGFYLDLANVAPGPVVTTMDELIEALRDPGAGFELKRVEFKKQFAAQDDGGAAHRVVDSWLGPVGSDY